MTNQISNNLHKVRNNIAIFSKKYNRNSGDVNLIAVSKTILQDKIEDAIKSGCKDFGENRVEESLEKWPDLKIKYPDIKLHLIGRLQSKKAKKAVTIFDYIHSVDSIKLANILKNEMDKKKKYPKLFIQVNIGSEVSKTGVDIREIDNFINILKNEIKLDIFGLMCIPPADEEASPYFTLLYNVAQKYKIPNLSMGMSRDYESAIASNSNYIRIGTSIFGKRN